ncbi:MAG: hypothetical protein JW703_05305 [Candidatus Diapherotrites archaeon]|nr:hypothetical protein [Candidatus Diapherotrites archaeon]
MGLKDFFGFGKKKEEEIEEEEETESKHSDKECDLCGKTGADKKWAGQYWHKKCMRQAKKAAKKMI